MEKGHVAVGRDDVGAIGLHDHAILNLEDLHVGVAPDEISEDAFMIRGKVLDQNKSHARIGA